MLRLGRRGGVRALREDGSQRHRVRRHAAHRRGLQHHEGHDGLVAQRDGGHLCRLERHRARLLPDRNYFKYFEVLTEGKLDAYLASIDEELRGPRP